MKRSSIFGLFIIWGSFLRYIYPPRPTLTIHPRFLPDYENTWFAQRKYNGQRNLIHVLQDGNVEFWGRHGKAHEYSVPSFLQKEISGLSLDKGKEYWIDSELLHNKTSTIKDTIVIYDILFAGKLLFGVKQLDRLHLMNKICNVNPENEETSHLGIQVSDSVFVAKSFTSNFCNLFGQALNVPELEGLVLRNPNSKLDNLGQKEYEVSWMIRCRKEHKNYSF